MSMTVANTILAQLGGNRFVAMTGAKNLLGSPNSLSFKVSCPKNKATHVRVTLEPSDTYTVEFIRFRKFEGKTLSTHELIYADMLQSLFTRETGLYTSL